MPLTIYRVALYSLREDPCTTFHKPPDSWIFVEEKLVTFDYGRACEYVESCSQPGPDRFGSRQKIELESTTILTTGWS